MKNATFEKALSLLTSPFGLSMLALLLVNDHILRRVMPSWWSGKLGDVAWLGFFPFVLAAGLAWALPARKPVWQRWVRALAFGLTGAVFALVKTLPAGHALATRAFETLFGVPSTLVRDPSDLLALPILWVGWRLWDQAAPPPRLPRWAALRLAALPAAALLTIANSIAPDYGIVCLNAATHPISAYAAYDGYTSADGGLTWVSSGRVSFSDHPCPGYFENTANEWQEMAVPTGAETYRYRTGDIIQVSQDGGQTWQTAYLSPARSEAIQAYVTRSSRFNPVYRAGPFDAVVDPLTGNLIFSMGHEGVLVRTPSGEWQPAAVGRYRPLPAAPDFAMLQALLSEQAILALLVGLLAYAILTIPHIRLSKKWLYAILWLIVVAAGLAWLFAVLLFPPTLTGYGSLLVMAGQMASAILLAPTVLALSIDLFRDKSRRILILKMALVGLGSVGVFFLPSLLWAYNFLTTAWTIALSLLLAAAVTGFASWKLWPVQKPGSPTGL